MEVSRGVRARLTAAFGRGETPTPSTETGLALKVGSVIVKGADGIITPAGHAWLQLGGTIPRRFTNVRSDRRNRHEFTMVAGRGGRLKRLYLRTWDPATERYTTTRAGRAQGYHDQVRFIVHVPVAGHVEDRTFDTTRDGRALTLPVDSAEVFQMHPELHTLAVVRAHESQARMTEFIREAIITFLRGLARDPAAFDAGREKVALTDYNQSDVWYSFNSAKAREIGNWTFDMELERFQDADHPTNETVLGRPLRAFIEASDDMWMKHHIVAEAFTSSGVNCVVQQLLVVLRRRKCVGNSRGEARQETQEPQFHPKALEVLIDQIAAFRYPGKGARIAYEALEEKERKLLKKYHKQMEEKIFEWGSIHSFAALRENLRRNGARDYKGFAEALQEAYGGTRNEGTARLQRYFDRFFHRVEYEGQAHYVSRFYDFEPVGANPAVDELWEQPRPQPYERADWREVGVTSTIVIELCRILGRPCKVVFGSACVFEYHPEGWGELDEHGHSARMYKTLVWNIRGEHAFFNDLPAGCKLELKKLTERPREKVRTHPLDMDDPIAFNDMVWFTPAEFMKAFEDKSPVVFKTVDTEAAEAFLERQQLGYKLGLRGDDIGVLHVPCGEREKKARTRKGIQIRRVSVDWERLSRLVDDYNVPPEEHELADEDRLAKSDWVHYHGEEAGGILLRLFEHFTRYRRVPLTEKLRQEIAKEHEGRCGLCGDEVEDFEIHHAKPVAEGGDNDRSNLMLLCPPCHRSHTDQQENSGNHGDLCSVLCPELMSIFDEMPKPKQEAWGGMHGVAWVDGRLDWRAWDRVDDTINCLDVKACRVTALTSRETLPSFRFKDAVEPVTPEGLAQGLGYYDFYFVDLGHTFEPDCRHELTKGFCPHCTDKPCEDHTEEEVRMKCPTCRGSGLSQEALELAPYRGPQWMPTDAVQYLAWRRIVRPEHLKWGVRASVQVRVRTEADSFRKQPRDLHYFMHTLLPRIAGETEVKPMRLALIGVFGRASDLEWVGSRTTYDQDVGPFDRKTFDRPGRPPICKVAIKSHSPRSYMPVAHIVLWREQIYIIEARRAIWQLPVNIYGELVDGIFFGVKFSDEYMEQWLREWLSAPEVYKLLGPELYQLKREPIHKVCRRPQTYPLVEDMAPSRREWLRLDERDDLKPHIVRRGGGFLDQVLKPRLGGGYLAEAALDRIYDYIPDDYERHVLQKDPLDQAAALVVANGGGVVQGAAGVGKTEFLKRVLALIKRDWPDDPIYTCAEMHVAARLLPDGQTISHLIHRRRYNKMHKSWIIVDEASQVHLHFWARMAPWKLLGARFIVVGDFKGQFLPIGEKCNLMEDSRQLHHLCNGLELTLSTYRRGADAELFRAYTGLYKHVRQHPARVLKAIREKYPLSPGDVPPSDLVTLVISHQKRMRLNHYFNQMLKDRQPSILVKSPGTLKGTSQQPQDMHLWEGIELMGCSRSNDGIVNGVTYIVRAVTATTVTVDMDRRFWLSPQPSNREVNLTLSHKDAGTLLRLSHALVYANVQGRTIRDRHVVLLDTVHRRFTMRHLIVGMSRVTDGRFLHLPTIVQEDALMAKAPPLPAQQPAEEDEDMGVEVEEDED